MNGKEFIKAVKNITAEKGISEDIVFDAMEQALITAYKKNFNSKTNVKVTINRETGDIKVFSYLVSFFKLLVQMKRILFTEKSLQLKKIVSMLAVRI